MFVWGDDEVEGEVVAGRSNKSNGKELQLVMLLWEEVDEVVKGKSNRSTGSNGCCLFDRDLVLGKGSSATLGVEPRDDFS